MTSLRIPAVALLVFCFVAPVARGAVPVAAAPTRGPERMVLPFIADDYAKALDLARARKLPIFIEAWAPW